MVCIKKFFLDARFGPLLAPPTGHAEMRWAVFRGLVLVAVVLSASATEEAAEPTEPEPVPAEGAAAEDAVPEEPEIVLNCNANGVLPRCIAAG